MLTGTKVYAQFTAELAWATIMTMTTINACTLTTAEATTTTWKIICSLGSWIGGTIQLGLHIMIFHFNNFFGKYDDTTAMVTDIMAVLINWANVAGFGTMVLIHWTCTLSDTILKQHTNWQWQTSRQKILQKIGCDDLDQGRRGMQLAYIEVAPVKASQPTKMRRDMTKQTQKGGYTALVVLCITNHTHTLMVGYNNTLDWFPTKRMKANATNHYALQIIEQLDLAAKPLIYLGKCS